MTDYEYDTPQGRRMRLARTRGMTSGVLLMLLGAWAAIVPFIGDYMDFAYRPTSTWTWTAARGWYEVLPGCLALLGGLMLLVSRHRMVALAGGWLGAIGGAWLVIGPVLSPSLTLGSLGTPATTSTTTATLMRLFYFYAVGAAILFVASVALGRLSVRSMRDIRVAREEAILAERAAAERKRAAAAGEPVAAGGPMGAREPVAAPARTEPGVNRQHHGHFSFLHRHRGQEQTAPPTQTYGPEGYPAQTSRFPAPEQQDAPPRT
jgi:hypothetical protein